MLTRSRSASRDGSVASSESSQSSGYSSSQSQSQDDSAPVDDYVPKKKKVKGRAPPVQPDQWVCLMPDEVCVPCKSGSPSTDPPLSFTSLIDPRTGGDRRYIWRHSGEDGTCGKLCEVLKFSDEPRSWFMDNSIQTDGSLFLCTPADPLFIALPYLMESAKSGKFTTLEAMLEEGSCKDIHILKDCVQSGQWKHLCDVKSISDEVTVYKFSREKAMSWLKAKVEAQATSLEEKKVYVGVGSQSSLLVKSNKRSDLNRNDYIKYACGMVCEYLPTVLASELEESYREQLKTDGEESEPPAKRPHLKIDSTGALCNGEPLEDYTKMADSAAAAPPPTKLAGKMSASQRALAKVDKTGMKSITSFFAPKNKNKK